MINITPGNGLSDFPGMEGRGDIRAARDGGGGGGRIVVDFVGNITDDSHCLCASCLEKIQ